MRNITGINLYAYCHNNPIMNYDPDGHFILETLFAIFVVAAVQSAIGAIEYAIWDSLGWIQFDEKYKLTIKHSYLVPGFFAKKAFLELIKINYRESWSKANYRSMTDYLFEWIAHNSVAYPFLVFAAIVDFFGFKESEAYEWLIEKFLQAETVDMENEEDWWKLWEHL